MNISVIIPVHNAMDTIGAVLDAVVPELHDDDQLIVADDRSTDGTESLIGAEPKVEYTKSDNPPGAAGTRNAGAARAVNQWLLFIDSDAVPAKGWRSVLENAVRRDIHGIQGIYGEKAPGSSASTFYKNYYYHYTFTRRIRGPEISGCATFFFAVRRDMFDRIGGFDENFAGATVEDAEFASRLVGAGGRILLVPDLRVHHLREYSFLELMGYEWRMMTAKMALLAGKAPGKPGSLTVSMARPSEMVPLLASSFLLWLVPAGLFLLLLGSDIGIWMAAVPAVLASFLQMPFWFSMISEGGWRGARAALITIPDLMMLMPAVVSSTLRALLARRRAC